MKKATYEQIVDSLILAFLVGTILLTFYFLIFRAGVEDDRKRAAVEAQATEQAAEQATQE